LKITIKRLISFSISFSIRFSIFFSSFFFYFFYISSAVLQTEGLGKRKPVLCGFFLLRLS